MCQGHFVGSENLGLNFFALFLLLLTGAEIWSKVKKSLCIAKLY